jgi:hypothetical protein
MRLKTIATALLMSIYFYANGQTDFTISYNSIPSAIPNLVVTASTFASPKNEFGGGLRFHFASYELPDDQNKLFYKRLFAAEPYQEVGITGFYHRYIFSELQSIKPFAFYDVQLAYAAQRINGFGGSEYRVTGPYTWMDNSLGLGFKANIYGHWYLQQKLGFATTLIFGESDNFAISDFNYVFGYFFQAGICYRI